MLQGEHSNDYTSFVLRGSAGHRSTDFSILEDSYSDCFQSLSFTKSPLPSQTNYPYFRFVPYT